MAENTFVNVDFSNHPELLDGLQRMVAEDKDMDRSKFIRKLVRKEIARRDRRDALRRSSDPQKVVTA